MVCNFYFSSCLDTVLLYNLAPLYCFLNDQIPCTWKFDLVLATSYGDSLFYAFLAECHFGDIGKLTKKAWHMIFPAICTLFLSQGAWLRTGPRRGQGQECRWTQIQEGPGLGGQEGRVSLTGRAAPGEGGGEASSGRLLLNHLQVHLKSGRLRIKCFRTQY